MKLESGQDDAEDIDADDIEDGLSLEELSQSYSNVLKVRPSVSQNPGVEAAPASEDPLAHVADGESDDDSDDHCPATPLSIVEAVLFVGRPDSAGVPASDLASLMRGVQESEIAELVQQLNTTYVRLGHAFRIVDGLDGYRVGLADDLEFIREKFYGRVREVKLNQAAIDCLALISYQPGITREALEKQRGQPSGGILNQLVRRQLIEIRREGEGKHIAARYFPTDRLVKLAGLGSLEDLPQVEEFD